MRVPLPVTVGETVPRATIADLVGARKAAPSRPASTTASLGEGLELMLSAAAIVVFGVLIFRKMFPETFLEIHRQFNPWAAAPAAQRQLLAKVRAEEEAFGEFLAAFRVGPVPAPVNRAPQPENPVMEFYARAKEHLVSQRTLLQGIGRDSGDSARHKMLENLHHEMGMLKGEAGIPEALPMWQVASAMEGLLKQLTEKMRNVTPSTLRSVTGGLDLLDELCVPGLKPDILTARPLKFLVVDDELISRQALSHALNKAFSQPDLAVDGKTALAQAGRQTYDVIFLDVQMPGMNGFELCTKIRETIPNRTTPVVFVTGQSDFDARVESTLSGGNDLLGKPFLTFEVTVKALTLALQGRLQQLKEKPMANPDEIRNLVLPVANQDGPARFAEPTIPTLPSFPEPLAAELEATTAFLARASRNVGALQELCRNILRTPAEDARQNMLAEGFLCINSLVATNGSKIVHPAYQISAALEGLFRKLLQNPRHTTPSTLATMAGAVDLLNELCVPGLKADLAVNPAISMLVVDDDLVARRAIVGALQTVLNKPESAEDGTSALVLARERHFDVIFLDVLMPGMDGFEVCSKIRDTTSNRATPVVFVTGHDDFETRAKAAGNGGSELIGKPFLTPEITVKALTLALRGRLQQHQAPAVA